MKFRVKAGKEIIEQTGDTFQADLWTLAEYGSAAPLFDRQDETADPEQPPEPADTR
jgi:hypothetical protein